jgi:pyrophosphatase PpaX
MSLACLLIDHDDTLMSTFALRASVMQRAIKQVFAVSVDGVQLLRDSHGQSLQQMASAFSESSADIDEMVRVYRGYYYAENTAGGVTPFAGITDVLRRFKQADVPVAVVTSKLGRGARDELEACALLPYVRTVVGAEDVHNTKPDPEPLMLALARIHGSHESALMVGDTSADILGARAAGAFSAAALWGAAEPESLLASDPDHILTKPDELLALFGLD